MEITATFGDPAPFVYTILKELDELGLEVGDCEIDHICYKPATLGQYEKQKLVLEKISKLLTETMINGRPISTYELKEPIEVDGKKIPLFELPAPKKGHQLAAQYEHIEMVLVHMGLEQLQQKYPHLAWDTHNINHALNPELTLKLDFGLVKFHPASLAKVIELETNELWQKNAGKLLITTLQLKTTSSAQEGTATLFSVLKCQGVNIYFLTDERQIAELKPIVDKSKKTVLLGEQASDQLKAQTLSCDFVPISDLRHANQLYDFLGDF